MSTPWALERGAGRASRALAALVLVASLEVACGGQAGDPAGMPTAAPSTPVRAAPQPTSAAPPATTDSAPPAATDGAPPASAPVSAVPPAMSPPAAQPAPEPSIEPLEPEMLPAPEPAASISVEGCLFVGGYDRVFFFQRDDARGICAELVLIASGDEPSEFDLTSLSLPPRWGVESMSAFSCTPEGALVAGTIPNDYRAATGSVAFAAAPGGLPSRATLAVMIMHPAEDADPYPDPLIMGQELRADDLALQGSCPLR